MRFTYLLALETIMWAIKIHIFVEDSINEEDVLANVFLGLYIIILRAFTERFDR